MLHPSIPRHCSIPGVPTRSLPFLIHFVWIVLYTALLDHPDPGAYRVFWDLDNGLPGCTAINGASMATIGSPPIPAPGYAHASKPPATTSERLHCPARRRASATVERRRWPRCERPGDGHLGKSDHPSNGRAKMGGRNGHHPGQDGRAIPATTRRLVSLIRPHTIPSTVASILPSQYTLPIYYSPVKLPISQPLPARIYTR